ncbi:MAG: hypothetical protein QOE93_1921 [Actinomycetota bacterium]|nr:hypothetical protein [Actinomycetota bacterium]
MALVVVVAGACSDGDSDGDSFAVTTTTSTSTPAPASTTTSIAGGTVTTATSAPTTATTGVAGEVTIRGTVSGLFASARVLQFEPPVDGYSRVALTEETEYRRADGSPAAFIDVNEGTRVEVTGEPGSPGALIARLVVVLG